MKPINKILNKPSQILGELTKQALMNKYYTKIVQKYLNNPLNTDTFVSSYKNGNLIIATNSNERLTLLRYAIPDLLINLRKDSSFVGLVSIKPTINKLLTSNNKDISKEKNNLKNSIYLSDKASSEIENLAKIIKHNKLNEALLKLAKRKDNN